MKGLPLSLKMFISSVLIVAALIFVLQGHRDAAIDSDSVATNLVNGQDDSSASRSDGTTLLRTSGVSEQRQLSKNSSNSGERDLRDNTRSQVFIRDGVSTRPVIPDGLVEVQCLADESTFRTEVLVEATGDSSVVSEKDKLALQSTFVTEYNKLVSTFCDDQHRELLGATIVETIDDQQALRAVFDREHRGLLMGSVHDTSNDKMDDQSVSGGRRMNLVPFFFHFVVNGACTGCPPDAHIYDDVRRRRLDQIVLQLNSTQQQHQDLPVRLGRGLQTNARSFNGNDKCYCPRDPVASRPPTTEEFLNVFSRAVDEQELEGVESVPALVEAPVSELTEEAPARLSNSGIP